MKYTNVKQPKLLRRTLSVIAAILAVLMVVSGVMYFVVGRSVENPSSTEQTVPSSTSDTILPDSTLAREVPEDIITAQPATETVDPGAELVTRPPLPADASPLNEHIPPVCSIPVDADGEQPSKNTNHWNAPGSDHPGPAYESPPDDAAMFSSIDSEYPAHDDGVGESSDNAFIPEEEARDNAITASNEAPASVSPEKTAPVYVPQETQPTVEPPSSPMETQSERAAIPEPTTATTTTEPAILTEATFPVEPISEGTPVWGIIFCVSVGLLAADLVAILLLGKVIVRSCSTESTTQTTRDDSMQISTGTVHQIGARDHQQDNLGRVPIINGRGMLAVVADGMGGLSDGDKVSQQIVKSMLIMGQQLKSTQVNGILSKMLTFVNEEINRTLGPNGLYKCGSTMVAVLIFDGQFQWISVGDSRIYLYRQGYANQLNQEHNQFQTLLADVLEGRRSYEEAIQDPDAQKLTSFIGMGRLKYADTCHSPIGLEPGDRLVLMTDGIYNIVSEERLAAVLHQFPDVAVAASVLDCIVQDAHLPYQDNYTALILGFDGECVDRF